MFRIGLFYKFIFYVGSVVIGWLIFKWNRMCVVILWGVCCWLSIEEIEVIYVKLFFGKGNKKKCYVDFEKLLKEKKSFIKINNRD